MTIGRALPGFHALGLILPLPADPVSHAASPEPAGCVSETGSGGACLDGTALDGATGVTLSPDGSSVYVAVSNGNFGNGYLCKLNGTTLARQASILSRTPRTIMRQMP